LYIPESCKFQKVVSYMMLWWIPEGCGFQEVLVLLTDENYFQATVSANETERQ
jgi:hypothetical protein